MYTSLEGKLIVLTRPLKDNTYIKEQLEKENMAVYEFPAITIETNILSTNEKEFLKNLDKFDWIFFTSANGVTHFLNHLTNLSINSSKILKDLKIAAVGPSTASKAKELGLKVDFIPSSYSTQKLSEEIKNIKYKKILLVRSDIAPKDLKDSLERKGAIVTNIPIYKTEYSKKRDERFENLIRRGKINYIIFTSSSCIIGFFKRIKSEELIKEALTVPVISIGDITGKTALKYGFKNVNTADKSTINGIIDKLYELNT